MCLDNIEEIAAAVEAAKKAKEDSAFFEQKAADAEANNEWQVAIEGTFHVSEIRLIHARRIEAAEAKLRDLGFRGPVVKAAPVDAGDAQRTLASNRTGESR